MSVLHSSRSDRWGTPRQIADMARKVLGRVDLDPASEPYFNRTVQASRFFSEEDEGLQKDWQARSVFLNPPGGKKGNRSLSGLFWEKLMQERAAGQVGHAIFLGFSVELLQSSQRCELGSICDFPFCVPRRRIQFESPEGVLNNQRPSHSNVIVYVPGYIDETELFLRTFGELGATVRPR